RRRAETHDRVGLDKPNLRVQPRPAGPDLRSVRLLVNPPLPARFPFEMLYDIGDVDTVAIDARLLERTVEQAAGRTHERPTGQIFGVARLLADQHQLGAGRAFAEHGLRAEFVQIAGLAILRGVAHACERGPARNQFGRRLLWTLRHGSAARRALRT